MLAREEIETALREAEAQVTAAREHHLVAQRHLWAVISRSGREQIADDELEAARYGYAEAERAQEDAEASSEQLRQLLERIIEHEKRLGSVADVGVLRGRARTGAEAGSGLRKRRGLLGLFRRR